MTPLSLPTARRVPHGSASLLAGTMGAKVMSILPVIRGAVRALGVTHPCSEFGPGSVKKMEQRR